MHFLPIHVKDVQSVRPAPDHTISVTQPDGSHTFQNTPDRELSQHFSLSILEFGEVINVAPGCSVYSIKFKPASVTR